MKSDAPLDYAVFQLSPRRSRCELFVSSDGNTEKLASGLVKPFVTQLKVAEEQVALAVPSIKLEIERHKNAETWFTKGTLERFVRFVSTPEVLEMVNTLDTEMSQLEAARRIYSQGAGDQRSDAQGGNGPGATAAADATKNELLRAIDVRLTAVRQDLTAACSRASAAGFNPDTVSELQQFADRFGAYRLNEACTKFMSLYQRRPDLIGPWKAGVDDRYLRSSVGSDMSIDDPTEDQCGPHVGPNQAHSSDQSNSSTWQQQKSPATFAFRRNSNVNEKDNNSTNESKDDVVTSKQKKEEGPTESSPPFTTPVAPTARRLSVQDRINLFENKQKENSAGSGGVLKPVVGKSVELRRLSSDVPAGPTSVVAAEKSVLRRWSGASDMSIDVNGEKKDIESPLCTPSSVYQTKSNTVSDSSDDKDQRVLNNSENKLDAVLKDQTDTRNCFGVSTAKDEEGGFNVISNCKDQAASGTKLRSFIVRAEQVVKTDQFSSQETSEVSVFDEKSTEVAAQKSIGVVSTTVGDVTSDVKARREDSGVRSRLAAQSLLRASHSHCRSFSGQFEGGGGIKFDEAPSVKVEVDKSTNQPQWRSTREVEDSLKKDIPFSFSAKQQIKVGDSEVPKMNYQTSNSSSREQSSKSHGKRDETQVVYNSKLSLPGKGVEIQDSIHGASLAPLEQVQRVRQSKGNQGLNDELKMKANELEKLFAEHKMRVPGEQSGSAQRIEPADLQAEYAVNSHSRGPGAGEVTPQLPARNTLLNRTGSLNNLANFDAKSLMKMVENHFSDINFRDDSRGKFYEKYMQKRDAKLREDWSSNRAEKEARMKAMQDSLERSRAEMKAKFSGSTERQDSVSGACQRVEKIRSFNFRSNINREQHPINSLQNEEDEDLSDVPDEKTYGGSKQSKKNLPNRNTSSTTPRTAAASVSRSSAKVSNSSTGRRRDNPLAQSVPNFSDLRKENTRPSSGVSKTTTRSQVRNYSRSKSTNEEMAGIKEEKSRRALSLQKSSANPAEFKDLSPLNSDGVVLDPLKFGMDAVRMKASVASEMQKNEESDEMEFEEEDAVDMVQGEDDGIETTAIGDGTFNGKVRMSQDSEKSGNSGSEIGDSTRSPTELEPVSVAEMPTAIPSAFNNVGSLQDSPVESPVSWNSRLRHPFSYPHESSDIDASVDSPIGSPAYWNSHSLAQADTDAARMRKKWGSAQKPILVANASHNPSRKDVTKGFKRLLKFGRKNRGSESLVDWISATTSEGDDDTEDVRDPANRSSEDLRKTRMGFSQGHPSDDSFNESELFHEQVQSLRSSIPAPPAQFKLRDDHISGSSLKAPRSFFSLSSFRSKGSDAKPR